MEYDIKNKKLNVLGRKRIDWALNRMPVLEIIRKEFRRTKPFKDVRIAACLHVTTETAGLVLTLKEGGAKIKLCASNPLSTQDDVAASLVSDYGVEVFAINGENRRLYYEHIKEALKIKPHITIDDGADLVSTIHKERDWDFLPWGGTEETTTGVIRLKALEKSGLLKYPIIAVNDSYTKHLFDNRYGTGQSTLDGIIRATNKLVAGTKFVVCGYGWCGRGIANRAKGLGAEVFISEVDPLKALEAVMDGFSVLPLKKGAMIADIIVTATGDISVLREEHFKVMKDRVLLANAGHFNVEIDLEGLRKMSRKKRVIKPLVEEYLLKDGRRIYVLGEGRLVNLACAEGHPAEVMDLSFANQALACKYIIENKERIKNKVFSLPYEIDESIARMKLVSMGIKIDRLTLKQKRYLSSWKVGT